MTRQLKSDRLMRDYLLGLLSENEQEQTEQRLMTESGFADELEITEQELVDEYADGLLTGREKEGFERLFLSHPKRRQDVAFARALRKYVSSHSTGRRATTRWQLLALAAAAAVIIAGSLLSYRAIQLRRQEVDLRAGRPEASQPRPEVAPLPKPQPPERTLPKAPPFVAFTLLPGLVRSQGGTPKLILTPGEDVQLRLVLEDGEYPQYTATLRTAEDRDIWRQDGLRSAATSAGNAVTARLSPALLKPDDYVLRLTGKKPDGSFESVGSYYFRIETR